MATIRPKLAEIINRIHNDAVARLDEEELRRSDLLVFERVIAGASHSLYSAIQYGIKQLFSDTAETSYLERQAIIYGLSRRQATKAKGLIQFTFANGLVNVPIGTVVQNDIGYQYVTTSAVDTKSQATIKSVEHGVTYNIASGVNLSLPTPIAGVVKAITVSNITGGTDTESDDSLRSRILHRTQCPPRQGTKDDYIAWAQEVEGVGKAWCYPMETGEGTVTIRFLDDKGNIPTDELINKVQDHVKTKDSIFGAIHVLAPIAKPFNFKLKIEPDNLANRELAEKAIKALFVKEAEPGGKIYLSHINAAISAIASEDNHIIVEPTVDIVADSNSYLPTVGEITWQQD